jgi:hypothetical protein
MSKGRSSGLRIVPERRGAQQLQLLSPRRQYPSAFDELWDSYPSRGEHGNSKVGAYRCWLLALRNGHTEEEMLAGTRRYKSSCDATGKTGTEYVMQTQRFLGRDAHYLEAWTAPARGTPWEPRRWTPPPDVRGEVPAGYLTGLLDEALRKHR